VDTFAERDRPDLDLNQILMERVTSGLGPGGGGIFDRSTGR
jgi:hypothetical protein